MVISVEFASEDIGKVNGRLSFGLRYLRKIEGADQTVIIGFGFVPVLAVGFVFAMSRSMAMTIHPVYFYQEEGQKKQQRKSCTGDCILNCFQNARFLLERLTISPKAKIRIIINIPGR